MAAQFSHRVRIEPHPDDGHPSRRPRSWQRATVVALAGGLALGVALILVWLASYLLPMLVVGLPGTALLGWLVARAAGPRQHDDRHFWLTVTALTGLGLVAAWGAFVLSFMLLWTLG
jgi:hypothetical protein